MTGEGLRPGRPASKAELRRTLELARLELDHGGFYQPLGGGTEGRRVADRLSELALAITDFGAAPAALDQPGPDAAPAIQAAIDSLFETKGGGTVLVPPGVWWLSGIRMAPRVRLQGAGWNSILKLLPGADQHVVRQSDRVDASGRCPDEMYQLADLAIDGNRDAQSRTAWVDGIHFQMTFKGESIAGAPDNQWITYDHQHVLSNLLIKNCKRDGLYLSGKGGHGITGVHVGACSRYGINLDTYDNAIALCFVGGIGSDGFHVSHGPNKFSACKAFFTGQGTARLRHGVEGEGVEAEDWRYGAGWFLGDGAQMCAMFGCEAQDTWSHGVVMRGKECIWDGHVSQAGSLRKRFGLGADPAPDAIGGFLIEPNAQDNLIRGLVRDQFVRNHSGGPYASHAVLWRAGAAGNEVTLRIPKGHVAVTADDATEAIRRANWITYRGP